MYTAHVHFFTNLDLFCIDNVRVIYRKIRKTNSEYVILIAFPLKQCLHERASMLRYPYLAWLVLDNFITRVSYILGT